MHSRVSDDEDEGRGRRRGEDLSPRGRTRLAARAGRWLAGALAALLLAEVAVRLAGLAPPLPKIYRDAIYVPDPHLPYHQRPLVARSDPGSSGEFREVFTHNSAGFRDVEHELAKPAGTFRVLAVGGSLAYGTAARFEETFLYVLEDRLNRRFNGHPRVEIIKAGIGGFFPQPERLLLEHYGLAYDPDLLLVQVDATDPVETHLGMDEIRVYPGFLKTLQMRQLGTVGTFLALHSHIGRICFRRWSRLRRARLEQGFAPGTAAAWAAIETELLTMSRLMADHGGRMAVCYVPLEIAARDDPDLEAVRAICERHGLGLVDATPYLREAAQEGPVFWERDGHCTPRGYNAIARAAFDVLVAQEWIR